MIPRTDRVVFPFVSLLLVLLLAASAAAADKIEVVESETGFYYTIQKGDTLWDLSQHFSDSPWLWPELWEENDQISNPHWIFPGERIRLYRKKGSQTIIETETETPAVAVVEPEAPAEPVQPVEKKRAGPFFVYESIDRVGFIRKPAVAPEGKIVDMRVKKWMMSEGDIVYVRPSSDAPEGALIPGSRHTIFRYMQPTEDHRSMETIGVQHYILGILEVTQLQQDLAVCKIVKSYRPIEIDDMLMPFSPRHINIAIQPATPGIDGQIIVSEDHNRLTGEWMLAFIDKGSADEIHVGQQYSVYSQENEELASSSYGAPRLPATDYGTILVLHTERTTSTVIVVNAKKTISPGERFRTPLN